MAKKYLLYIHDERFDSEPKKSELVNRLLAEHYSLPPLRDKPLGIPPVAKKPKESLPSQLTPRFCKNGHPIPYPRDKCLGKGCKYA